MGLESMGEAWGSGSASHTKEGVSFQAMHHPPRAVKSASPKAWRSSPDKGDPSGLLPYQMEKCKILSDLLKLLPWNMHANSFPCLSPKLKAEGQFFPLGKWEVDLPVASMKDFVLFLPTPFPVLIMKILVWIKRDGLNMCNTDKWNSLCWVILEFPFEEHQEESEECMKPLRDNYFMQVCLYEQLCVNLPCKGWTTPYSVSDTWNIPSCLWPLHATSMVCRVVYLLRKVVGYTDVLPKLPGPFNHWSIEERICSDLWLCSRFDWLVTEWLEPLPGYQVVGLIWMTRRWQYLPTKGFLPLISITLLT